MGTITLCLPPRIVIGQVPLCFFQVREERREGGDGSAGDTAWGDDVQKRYTRVGGRREGGRKGKEGMGGADPRGWVGFEFEGYRAAGRLGREVGEY
jgi:hypothetical protein